MLKSEKTGALGRHAQFVASLILTTLIAGCASFSGVGHPDFSCPERDHGVACHSVRDVYKRTEDRDQLSNEDFAEHEDEDEASKHDDRHDRTTQQPIGPHAPTVPAVDGPIPLRSPSKVMRIRLNYWESKNGNLHVPGYVYTEIEPRRWRVGLREPAGAKTLHPLQTIQQRINGSHAARSHGEPRRKNGTSMSAQRAAQQKPAS